MLNQWSVPLTHPGFVSTSAINGYWLFNISIKKVFKRNVCVFLHVAASIPDCMQVCVHMWPLDGRMQLYYMRDVSPVVYVGVCVLQDSSSVSLQQSSACDVPEKNSDRNSQAKDKYRAPHPAHFPPPSSTFFL